MRLGVLFQHGALFSALTVQENIQVPMREYLDLPQAADGRAGPAQDRAGRAAAAMRRTKFPSELSGGMIKRAALARALALDPDIVFLDEPTSGLDPIGAAEFDELIAKLRDTLGLTVYMVTHDLDSLFSVCDRIAVLGNKRVLVEGTVDDMLKSDEPWVKSYFRGKRARQLDLAARASGWKPEPTTSSSASSPWPRSSRPSASSIGPRPSATAARPRRSGAHSGLGLRPGARQRGHCSTASRWATCAGSISTSTIRRWRSPTPSSTAIPRSPNRPRPTSASPAWPDKPISS